MSLEHLTQSRDPPLGPLPRTHPREMVVRAAESAFNKFCLESQEWRSLTLVEEQQILLAQAAVCSKYLLRHERHPDDPGKPSGLE